MGDSSKTCWDRTDQTLKSVVEGEVEYILIGAGLPRSDRISLSLSLSLYLLAGESDQYFPDDIVQVILK